VSFCFVPDFAVIEGRLVEQPSVFVDDAGKAWLPVRRLSGKPHPGCERPQPRVSAGAARAAELRAEGNEPTSGRGASACTRRRRLGRSSPTVSKQAFVEMALTVGEFHYCSSRRHAVRHESLLAKTVIRAARDGACASCCCWAGRARRVQVAENPRQRRFIDGDVPVRVDASQLGEARW
jgi:hypothetical protein